MGMHLYWVSAITYAFVLGVILYSEKKIIQKKPTRLDKSFMMMVSWVIFFCLQDAFWGLCDSKVINNSTVFFISSEVFHISTVVTTFFWLKYVLDYLGDRIKYKKMYLSIDILFVFFELILVVINIFTPTLFDIKDGKYVVGDFRMLTFINQFFVYLATGIIALIFAIRKTTRNYANYSVVFVFTLAPIALGICQLLFPDAPFYSLGFFLGCFIIHIFIVIHERDEYLSEEDKLQKIIELNEQLEAKQKEIGDQFDILKSISNVYNYINIIDFDEKTAIRFDEKDAVIDNFDIVNDPHSLLNKKLISTIDETNTERFLEFTDLSTLDERMMGRKFIAREFRCTDNNWIKAMYIRIGENVREPARKIAYLIRSTTDDKKREEQVYFALTNLVYSLHIFDLENDTMDRLIESNVFKQIVGDETSAQAMSYTIIKATCKDEFLDFMLEFVDLSTVSKRMEKKKSLTCEFEGKYHGWTRMTFIPIEKKGNKVTKMVVTTQIIDAEKTEMMNLLYKSSTDELTRLYNRRSYEDELDSIAVSNDLKNLVIVALDVNGLKTVNDTLGHKAGDELIIGASRCIEDSFKTAGKAYRTGGDEFMAILKCDKDDLQSIFSNFDKSIEEWSGNLVKKLSISYGYALSNDYSKAQIRELAAIADQKMYESKNEYYIRNGIERRK